MPDLALPSHTALRLGAIHKRSSVPNLLHVENVLCFSMCAHAFGMGHSTLTRFDPLELICAEPDPVSGGTRLAKYPSLCQPNVMLSMCLCVMEAPPALHTLLSVTCQMCVHVFVLAFF